MNDWVTVITVELPMDAYLIRSQLELEIDNIEVQIPDEYTVEAYILYSHAIGGLRVQVRPKYLSEAIEVLTRLGHLKEEKTEKNALIESLSSITKKIPVLKKFRVEARILIFISLILLIIIVPFAMNGRKTFTDKLTASMWCVARVTVNGNELVPLQPDMILSLNGCSNFLSFESDGQMELPDYENAGSKTSWNEYKDGINIYSRDSWEPTSIFEGVYEVTLEQKRLVLRSESVYILCYDYSN